MTAAASLEIGRPYPVRWNRLTLVASVITPAPRLNRNTTDMDIARRWRSHAAQAEAYADRLDRLVADGWDLTIDIPYALAQHDVESVAQARGLVDQCDAFDRGFPIAMRVSGLGTAVCTAGGLLVGCADHPEVCPPSTIPALVTVQPTGAQWLVQSTDELRAAVRDGLAQLADCLESPTEQSDAVWGSDVPRAARALHERVGSGGHIPSSVKVSIPESRLWDDDEPRYTIDVIPVCAAVWSGMSIEMGVVSLEMEHSTLSVGLAGQLSLRGNQLATELEAAAEQARHHQRRR